MSTKTIALESTIYERLASLKKEGESFSRLIDRLLNEIANAHTGHDILRQLESVPALSQADAERFLAVVDENRKLESWDTR